MLKDQVLMSNGQLWGYMFDYPARRVKLYTIAEGEEYTDQALEVDYRLEDWPFFLQGCISRTESYHKGV